VFERDSLELAEVTGIADGPETNTELVSVRHPAVRNSGPNPTKGWNLELRLK
jgi:hypothetical protein